MTDGLIVDLFAGGGGASQGIEAALGKKVDIALNHDPVALAVHKANHPETYHVEADIWKANPADLVQGRPVALLWASPDCTHHSIAKGGKPRKKGLRTLAWAVYRWARSVRPAVIFIENVKEFEGWGPLTKAGLPDKRFLGKTFRLWVRRIEGLGYRVEHRMLDASLYGAPTRRRRLFIVARRDGKPIAWPAFTHGPGRLPVRTAAECIDWSLPCPSIFERKRDLAPKTQWRIAQGIRRFVLENPRPFLVKFQQNSIGQELERPLDTVMAGAPRFGLVAPSIVGVGGRAGQSAPTGPDDPIGTITTKNDRALVAPVLERQFGRSQGASIDEPMPVVTAGGGGKTALVAPHLLKVNHGDDGRTGRREHSLEEPLTTVTAQRRGHALAAATLVQAGYGEREGQAARVPGIEKPLGTVVSQGRKHSLVSAFLAKHYGGVVGHQLEIPVGTVTTRDHHSLAAASLVKLRGQCNGADVDAPVPTLTSSGTHLAEVRAFLTKYYNTARAGQQLDIPMHTVTTKDRMGLVVVEGVEYAISDIGMRMLEPHELLRAQFGRFAASYDLSSAKTKTAMVRLIGNSVCPEVAEALVRANSITEVERLAA